MNLEYNYIEIKDTDKFIEKLKESIKISTDLQKVIINEVKEMKEQGTVFYEEDYKGKNKVRIFNRYNFRLWDYINKNSKDEYDGTAKIDFSIQDVLKYFKINDTDENINKIKKDIQKICGHSDLIVGDLKYTYAGLVDSYCESSNGEKYMIQLPYSRDRLERFFKGNPIIG